VRGKAGKRVIGVTARRCQRRIRPQLSSNPLQFDFKKHFSRPGGSGKQQQQKEMTMDEIKTDEINGTESESTTAESETITAEGETETLEGEATTMRIETIHETLTCILTGDDRIAYGNEMSELLEENESLEVAKSETAKRYKTQIDSNAQRATDIAKIIRAGQEDRSVEVQKVYDYEALTITYIRKDTGETVRGRDMTATERQQTLFPDVEPTVQDLDEGLEDPSPAEQLEMACKAGNEGAAIHILNDPENPY